MPAQFSGKIYGGAARGSLDIENGKREREPKKGVIDLDNLCSFLDTRDGSDAVGTSESLTRKRERAPADGGDGLGYSYSVGIYEMPGGRSSLGLRCGQGRGERARPAAAFGDKGHN